MSSDVCHQIIYLAIELSSSSWVIAYRLPADDKAKLHRLEAGDGAGLLAFIAGLRHRLDPPDDASTLVVSCFEAGRDGFWLHRLLSAHGVINHVVEPTSILVTRARRAKTDRLDAFGLLRVLAAKFAGDPGACWTVVVPSVEEEDAKRPHREREFLVQERVRIENRIAALLATQGVRGRPSLRSWDADMRALRTGDGRPLPTHLVAELNRLRRRLSGPSTTGGKSPAIWVLPQRLFRAAAWIAIGASIAPATAEPAKRSSNSPGFGFATNQRAAMRHGSGTVLARFRVESAASQSSPWRASS